MIGYIIRRVLYSIIVIIGVLFTVFAVARLSPVDPVKYVLIQSGRNPGDIDPVEYAQMRHSLGLDRPIMVQFVDYVGQVLHGDFGTSIVNQGRTVRDIMGSGIPISLQLAFMGLILQFVIGNLVGILAAAKQNSLFDRTVMGVAIVAGSVPQLVWGVVFITIFAVQLRWLPIRGWDHPKNWILPTLTIAIAGVASYARFGRAAVLEQANQDFVRTARAKGLRQNKVLFGHILRNALVPIVTFVGPSFAFLITGNFVVETMFGVPGVAYYAINSSIHGDYPVMQATVLLIAIMIMGVNLLIDVLYGVIDPRIRLH
ncbi:MAG TPA: ABC transporter permease [Thermomicrobiaceae bacterium]|nr:ABC transporter permease [Thermomicrobiaceae bacterium]